MTVYRYHTCDVFTRQRFGGNPLAVVPDARGLDTGTMQALAGEFNYSETVFVFPARQGHTRQLRIFTPRIEVPFAGHPNVGTAFMLAALGEIALTDQVASVTFEEHAGLVPVRIEQDSHGCLFCELTAPAPLALGPEVSVEVLADAIGLGPEDIVTRAHPPKVASVGLPFLLAEIATRSALASASPDLTAFRALQAQGITPDIHLYTHDAGEFDLHTRMFAPLDGVPEDPATGSANSALIALLAHLDDTISGQRQWRIAQGEDMGRFSELFGRVDKSRGDITAARIGGYCVRVLDGSFSH
jgi:trans-2,3-dihydro-3-hydroxyanthranilate isomerase